MESSFKQAFSQIFEFLEDLEAKTAFKYYFVGGILVSLYSDVRITRDIDIIIDLNSSNITLADCISLLEKNYFHPLQDWATTLFVAKQTNKIRFLDKTTTVRLVNQIIVESSNDKYIRMGPIGLKNRVREKLFGNECWVASKEDFLLCNVVLGGNQNYTDALGCYLRFKNELDKDYLESVSSKLDLVHEFSFLESGMDNPDKFFDRLEGKKIL